jgi:hypothetical protein
LDPLVGLGPDQLLPSAPTLEAVQLVALVDDQVRVDDPPDGTVVGVALRFTIVTAGCANAEEARKNTKANAVIVCTIERVCIDSTLLRGPALRACLNPTGRRLRPSARRPPRVSGISESRRPGRDPGILSGQLDGPPASCNFREEARRDRQTHPTAWPARLFTITDLRVHLLAPSKETWTPLIPASSPSGVMEPEFEDWASSDLGALQGDLRRIRVPRLELNQSRSRCSDGAAPAEFDNRATLAWEAASVGDSA